MSTATAYADEIRRLSAMGFDATDINEATGADEGTVTCWARADRPPTGECRNRLLELVVVVERLSRVMDLGHAAVWLHKPVAALGDERPIDAVRNGRYRDVCKFITQLDRKMPS